MSLMASLSQPKEDEEFRSTDDVALTRHKTVLKRQRSLRTLGIVASVVSLVAFIFAIGIFIRSLTLENAQKQRTEAYLRASDRFAQVLADKEVLLNQSRARADQETKDITAVRSQTEQLLADIRDLRAQIVDLKQRSQQSRNF